MDKQNASEVIIAQSENKGVVKAYVDKARIAHLEEDMNILRAECIDLKRENKRLCDEVTDFKKTISKMQQAHEAEVNDLKDQLAEKQAEVNAVKRRKEEILEEHARYSEVLDNNNEAFEDIAFIAETAVLVSTASAKLAKHIIAKTEGCI